jgi:hypothetical protein
MRERATRIVRYLSGAAAIGVAQGCVFFFIPSAFKPGSAALSFAIVILAAVTTAWGAGRLFPLSFFECAVIALILCLLYILLIPGIRTDHRPRPRSDLNSWRGSDVCYHGTEFGFRGHHTQFVVPGTPYSIRGSWDAILNTENGVRTRKQVHRLC